MLKWKVKCISFVLSITLAAGVFCACTNNSNQGQTAQNEPVVLKFFDKNTGDPFNDAVAEEITKRTGVKIEIQKPTGDPMEKLNLMLASGDYPDIVLMDRSNAILDKYISAEALVPLNDLIQEYGPDVTEMYGDVLKKIKNDDGNIYYLTNWYGKDTEPLFGFIMRQDILKELAGSNAGNGKAFTQTEFSELLKAFKDKYPVINGKEAIPLVFEADDMSGVINTMKGMFGMKTYYEINGELRYDVRDPKYLAMLIYFNSLFREGLIDKDWIANKKNLWTQKLLKENTFATSGNYWAVTDINSKLKVSAGTDAQFYAYKVAADGVKPSETTYGGRSSLGWDAIGITENCKDKESAMKLINFLASEEGQYLMLWGVEGKTWNMVDGKHKPVDEILREFKEDFNGTALMTGVRHWNWFIKNGSGSDGTPFDMAVQYEKIPAQIMAEKNLGDSYWDTAEYELLLPKSGTDEALKYQNITEIFNRAFPKIIDASSEADVVNLYNKMVQDMDNAGLAAIEKTINVNYAARMKLWK